MSRAGCNRKTALATVTMVLAAEAADIDMVGYFWGSAVGFTHHRGFTHTIFGIPFVSAAVVALVYGCWRLYRHWRPLKPPSPDSGRTVLPPRWGVLYGLACLAGYSHLLLDFTNSYGLRPLFPVWNHWIAWDTVSIVEPIMLVFLLAGLFLPSLFGLVNQEIGAKSRGPRGRGGAITALVLIALLWFVRDYEHRRAIAAMNAVDYRGQPALRLGAFPYDTNPFKWHGVAETEKTFEIVPVDSLTPEVDPQGHEETLYKHPDDEVVRAAKASYLGRSYVDWARFLQIEVERREQPTEYLVRFRDLRYAYPERRGTPLGAYVLLDASLHVVSEGFSSSSALRDRLEKPGRQREP